MKSLDIGSMFFSLNNLRIEFTYYGKNKIQDIFVGRSKIRRKQNLKNKTNLYQLIYKIVKGNSNEVKKESYIKSDVF